MDRTTLLRHLAAADRHIENGEQIIADQERLIEKLHRRGEDSKVARSLLETFRQTQAQGIDHRDLILRELAE